jgi:hypothetical protein
LFLFPRPRICAGCGHKARAGKEPEELIAIVAGVLALVVINILLTRLKPAAPSRLGTIYLDAVSRERWCSRLGSGTLVPEDPVDHRGHLRASRKLNLFPGVTVDATPCADPVNPDVEMPRLNADRQQTDANPPCPDQPGGNKLAQAAAVPVLHWLDAKRRAESGAELLKKGLIILPIAEGSGAGRCAG